jgi:4-diphosphocytidyl-2-C-methyl-D-erythritol kinase
MLIEIAPAKINLTLEILGKRDDGFHEIRSVMQTVDICDVLTFWENPRIQVFPEYNNLPPADGFSGNDNLRFISDNLVYQAAELLKKESGHKGGAVIQLKKNIPSATGLGGGSSDAAATLKGLNRLWGLGLSKEDLAELGSKLGSDVPFFLYGGTCLATGRGEIITRLEPIEEKWVLLMSPPVTIKDKTKKLYSLIKPDHYSKGEFTENLNNCICTNKDIIKNNSNGSPVNSYLFNVFESIYRNGNGIFDEWKRCILPLDMEGFHLAGSGPTVFCMADKKDELVNIIENKFHDLDKTATYVVKTISDY